MIRVLYERNGAALHLSISGHAKSAEAGKDLVCAAVSAIATGGLNALQHPDLFAIVLKEGHADIKTAEIAAHDEIVILTMLKQLETVAAAHPQYIQITKKGIQPS